MRDLFKRRRNAADIQVKNCDPTYDMLRDQLHGVHLIIKLHSYSLLVALFDDGKRWWMDGKGRAVHTVCTIRLCILGRLQTLSDTQHVVDDDGIDTLLLLQLLCS